jgi:phosphoglycolate phosphatase
VVQALKEVYERYESNEYPFAIQESNLYEAFHYDFDSFDSLVITPAREAFTAARKKYLRPYRGVVETLAALKGAGVKVAALTDAPRNPAERRVKMMKLDEHLTAIYALPAFAFPDSGVSKEIRKREAAGGLKLKCPVHELPREYEKPDPRGYLQICKDLGVDPRETAFIGDSLRKDITVARKVGALDCWAEYGTYISAEYAERLSVISAPSATRRHLQQQPADGDQPPTVRLSNFDQILPLVQKSAVPAVA